mmetsp:Transcript_17511/g.51076  ORF Transcript_17511/g.51076 Transcript_17511/m.51076 type:complete len:296 (+) Transcript_17511:151-1038(+)
MDFGRPLRIASRQGVESVAWIIERKDHVERIVLSVGALRSSQLSSGRGGGGRVRVERRARGDNRGNRGANKGGSGIDGAVLFGPVVQDRRGVAPRRPPDRSVVSSRRAPPAGLDGRPPSVRGGHTFDFVGHELRRSVRGRVWIYRTAEDIVGHEGGVLLPLEISMPHRSSHDLSPMERRNRSAVRLAFLLWCGGIPPSISGLRLDDGRNGTRTVRVPPLLRRGAGTVPVPGRLFLHAIFLRRRSIPIPGVRGSRGGRRGIARRSIRERSNRRGRQEGLRIDAGRAPRRYAGRADQ